MMSTIAEIIRDLLIFVGVIAVLLIALVAVVTRLPEAGFECPLLSSGRNIGRGSIATR
jgi:hypothetical protein